MNTIIHDLLASEASLARELGSAEQRLAQQRDWYVGSAGDQGLVIDTATGRNIAVAYDKADAPLLAAAPEMFSALELAREALFQTRCSCGNGHLPPRCPRCAVNSAIAKAKG